MHGLVKSKRRQQQTVLTTYLSTYGVHGALARRQFKHPRPSGPLYSSLSSPLFSSPLSSLSLLLLLCLHLAVPSPSHNARSRHLLCNLACLPPLLFYPSLFLFLFLSTSIFPPSLLFNNVTSSRADAECLAIALVLCLVPSCPSRQ